MMYLGKMKDMDSQDLTDLRFKPKEKSGPSWQSVFLRRPKGTRNPQAHNLVTISVLLYAPWQYIISLPHLSSFVTPPESGYNKTQQGFNQNHTSSHWCYH
jgi:hypothetical protein